MSWKNWLGLIIFQTILPNEDILSWNSFVVQENQASSASVVPNNSVDFKNLEFYFLKQVEKCTKIVSQSEILLFKKIL